MPALPSSILEPLWVQVAALLPTRQVHHPLGCHRPRIPDRIVFDKLIQVLVFGCGYRRIADYACSATTLPRRRDEWIALGLAEQLRLTDLAAYDRLFGLELVITLDTVKRHLSNLFTKLQVTNRTQAVTRARDLGLLP